MVLWNCFGCTAVIVEVLKTEILFLITANKNSLSRERTTSFDMDNNLCDWTCKNQAYLHKLHTSSVTFIAS